MQTGKLLAMIYGMFSLVMVPFLLIGIIVNARTFSPMLVIVLIYPIMGFIGGIFIAALYNVAAKWVGGLEVSVESVPDDDDQDSARVVP